MLPNRVLLPNGGHTQHVLFMRANEHSTGCELQSSYPHRDLFECLNSAQKGGASAMTKLRKASISTAISLMVVLTSMLFQVTSASAVHATAVSLSPTLSVSSQLDQR